MSVISLIIKIPSIAYVIFHWCVTKKAIITYTEFGIEN